jgi:hypothetical protein
VTVTSVHVGISHGGDDVRLAPEAAEEREDGCDETNAFVEATSAARSPKNTGRYDTGRRGTGRRERGCLAHDASSELDSTQGVVVSIGDVEGVSVARAREARR